MAETATSTSNITLDELEAEITCLVCQGHYRDAKLLPCMHYYCKICINELAMKCTQGQSSFPCPECRKDTSLPSGSADELKSAFFVERMKDLFTKMSKADGKVETMCETCAERVTSFCCECTVFYCSDCSRIHLESSSDQHRLIDLVKDNGTSVDPNPLCPEHKDPMTVFCFTCECVACRDCIIFSHSGHNFNVLKKCALEKRRDVCNSLVPLRKVQLKISEAETNLDKTEEKIEEQSRAVDESIRESFTELRSLLDEREAKLSSAATALVKEKKDTLAAQRKGLQIASAEIKSLVEFVEHELECTSDKDLMAGYADLQSKILDKVKSHQQLSLKPTAVADIVCNLPSVSIIPEKMGNISCQPTVIQTSDVCDVNYCASSILYAASFTEIIVRDLQSLANPALSIKTNVSQKGSGVYEITYTPQNRGRHFFIVLVNSVEISGSPFNIFANIHPSLLREPVRIIGELIQPMGITFNLNKQLVVTECGAKQLAILSRDGERKRTVESEVIRSPRGAAIGPNGTFFVTCNVRTGVGYSCLVKLDYFGCSLKTVSLDNPFCLRKIRGRLYVCVRKEVKIFDMDCHCIGTLESGRGSQPYDIAEGNDCIYVVGNAAQGDIVKFSHDGHFRGVFQENLSRPRCICVNSAGFVFVTLSGGSSCVCVFEPNGDVVASFGMGFLRGPFGITVDEDGFIYVCDTQLNQIVVF